MDLTAYVPDRVVDQVAELDSVLAGRLDDTINWRRDTKLYYAVESFGEPDAIVGAVDADTTPPAGIYGVGITAVGDRELLAAVFVIPELADQDSRQAAAFRAEAVPAASVLSYFGIDTSSGDFAVVGLPMPDEQLSCGDALFCGAMRGTCGAPVRSASGQAAVLTAGHVAQPVGATVTAHGSSVGTVVFSDQLSLHGPADLVADAAVVELDMSASANCTAVTGQGAFKQFDSLQTLTQQPGNHSGWVRHVATSFALTPTRGRWAEVAITDRAISQAGDSGAAVVLDDGSGTIVGHIVAGSGQAYSLVQGIDYLLRASGATL